MNNDMIKQYNLSIKSLSQVVSDKKATLYMLLAKYEPEGLWDHGTELLEIEAEIDELEGKLSEKRTKLKEIRDEFMGVKPAIDTTPKLF